MSRSARSVTVIPASINPINHLPIAMQRKRRVAGYARVSTDSEEQQTSYEAQVDYYTHYIQSKPDWEFVKVYTDEGITATNTKKRDGFNQMVADALAGKIDLIVTKSVSRFARNTVDSLTTVRKLKEKGVEVYFEKENIYTLDSKGELLITIMSSLAQEESRSISENVTWGKRKQFADGKVALPYKHFLGYQKGPDGLPQIVPEEAEIIRRIYSMFILGNTPCSIAKQLTEEVIPTPSGKSKWSPTTIESMNKLSEISIEVEQQLYEEVSALCRNAGTSVEALTAAFFEFCIIPENLPLLKVFLGKEKAASEEAERVACRQVLEGVFQILRHYG